VYIVKNKDITKRLVGTHDKPFLFTIYPITILPG